MQEEKTNREDQSATMRARRETMADGRRYIIYYTFENDEKPAAGTGEDKTAQAEDGKNV